jgi:hypothetical protein
MITVAFAAKQWHVLLPEVYRYMRREHVEDFMLRGKLRLKLLNEFRKHPDEQRRDEEEGNFVAKHTNEQGSQLVWLDPEGIGGNAYVLCGSARPDLGSKFGDACFRIRETSEFAVTISAAIAQFREGIQGACIYTDDIALASDRGSGVSSFFAEDGGFQLGGSQQAAALREMRREPKFYFKKRTKFSSEEEYRFVWILTGSVGPHIDITCPAAVQFCERVS